MIFKVLIVDDDYINRRLLISLLKKELYKIEVLEAINGQDALQKCQDHQNIQLILLDVEMPEMDGANFLKHYKEKNILPNIPVIAVSSNDLRIKEILNLGANAFLLKPVTEEKLMHAIQTV